MGRPTLPDISSVEEVLDLITNPEKYITYMKEFRRIHQETVDMLGQYAAKDTLDAAVATLARDRSALEDEKAEAKRTFKAEAAETAHDLAHLEAQIEKYRVEVENEDTKLEEKERGVAQRYAELDQFEKAQRAILHEAQAEQDAHYAILLQREEILNAAKAKIEPVAKALGIVLE